LISLDVAYDGKKFHKVPGSVRATFGKKSYNVAIDVASTIEIE